MSAALPSRVRACSPETHDADTLAFETARPRLRSVAHRILGSGAEADDVVQQAWLRWSRLDHARLDSAEAVLVRIVTRLCLDVLKSSRIRYEVLPGRPVPEPTAPELHWQADMSGPLLLILQRLAPPEQAVFLLHDVFSEPLGQVARRLGKTPAAVRQIAVRARRRVRLGTSRYPAEAVEGDRLAEAFAAASMSGDPGCVGQYVALTIVPATERSNNVRPDDVRAP